MTDDTYNGYSNRETWAFNLHWQNDQGLYSETLNEASEWIANERDAGYDGPISDHLLGEAVVAYWTDRMGQFDDHAEPIPMPATLRRFKDEVGSWWRIDYAEVGAAVRESLDAES